MNRLTASVMCANLLRLEEDLHALREGGIDELHFDIMDGAFVPNLTLGFDMIKAARACVDVPCNAHLMMYHPERYVQRFVDAGCSSISVHVEACTHPHRVLGQIRAAGASPGIAVNPATPLTKLDYLLPEADRVLVMTVDPGYAGQAIVPFAFERVQILAEHLRQRKANIQIEVDGNISPENARKLRDAGARIFVLGTSAIFRPHTGGLAAALRDFRAGLEQR